MIYLCAQPDNTYFIWQLLTLSENFKEIGVDKEDIHFLIGWKDEINTEWNRWKDEIYANVHFIEDTRENRSYSPSIYPHLVKKFLEHSEINEYIFYHDSDVLFTSEIPFEGIEDGQVHLSRTNYLDYSHFQQWNSDTLLKDLTDVVGISRQTVIENEGGGAQIFAKGLTSNFWHKVEMNCYAMQAVYNQNKEIYIAEYNAYCNSINQEPKTWDFQIWTISMWSTLWQLWVDGYTTYNNPILDFSWPDWNIKDWDSKYIYHNSGVFQKSAEINQLMLKQNYYHTYIDKFDYLCNNGSYSMCQYYYLRAIERTANKYWLKDQIKPLICYVINREETDLTQALTIYNSIHGYKEMAIINTVPDLVVENSRPDIRVINVHYINDDQVHLYLNGPLCNLLT